jgi:hypothetical protein
MDTTYTGILSLLQIVNNISNTIYNDLETINPKKGTCVCFVLKNKDSISQFITDIILKSNTNLDIMKEAESMNLPSSILQGLIENNMNIMYTTMLTLNSLIKNINITTNCCMLSRITCLKLRKLVYYMLMFWYNSFIWNKGYFCSLINYKFEKMIEILNNDVLRNKSEIFVCIASLNQAKADFEELALTEFVPNETMMNKISNNLKSVKQILQKFGILVSSDKFKMLIDLSIHFNGLCRKWITSYVFYQNYGDNIREEYNRIEPFFHRTEVSVTQELCLV